MVVVGGAEALATGRKMQEEKEGSDRTDGRMRPCTEVVSVRWLRRRVREALLAELPHVSRASARDLSRSREFGCGPYTRPARSELFRRRTWKGRAEQSTTPVSFDRR